MKLGDLILTQTYAVGRVTKVEDPRVYYVTPDDATNTVRMAWLARVVVIPPEIVNTLWAEVVPSESGVEVEPERPRYQPAPALTPAFQKPSRWAAWRETLRRLFVEGTV